jgi:boron transporter
VGIPFPNGLVPQAPVHTDALTTYKDEVEITKTESGDAIYQKKTIATHVTEQRVSHFLMGLAIIGTMTRPLLVVLGTIPRAVLSGVFFIVGWGSIEGNGIIKNLLFLLTEQRFIQPSNPLLKIPKRRILLFVSFQLITWASSVAISQTIAAIGFPVIVTALIPFRVFIIPKVFEGWELEILDSLTATNEVVLASLGGRPIISEEMEMRADDGGEGGISPEKRGGSETDEKGGSGSGSFKGDDELRQRPRPREVPDGIGAVMGRSGEEKEANEI